MKKYYLTIAALMIAVLLGSLSCSAAAPSELKPCTVELGYVTNEWAGEEVIAANVYLTVKNPNPVPVTLDAIDYNIVVSKTEVALKTLVPKLIIPASGSVSLSNVSIIDYSASLATQKIYIGQGKDYLTAHVMAATLWKLLGGKEPQLWAYPAIQVYSKLKGGPTVDDVKAGKADMAAVVTLYATLRGTVDAVQGALDKAWAASPAGPCVYEVSGKATISYGSLIKETDFNLTYERKD